VPRAVEPPPSRWTFPDPLEASQRRPEVSEIVGVGADLEPGTVLAAYRSGLFPMPLRRGVMAWWSPDPRGVIPLEGLVVSRSLRKSCARFDIRIDTAFDEVLAACADRRRPGAWINKDIKAAYRRLFDLGWVHSVEAWQGNVLAGGLYGVAIGGLFAGESMFHHVTDASKVALVGLVELLQKEGSSLLDVQWATDHLQSLGAVAIPRVTYHRLLDEALARPQPPSFGG
jgi:leucyl/phenylalanyl-tRNA--protein transferase